MRDASLASVAVGFFDGVHLGHRAILRGADLALTFENHPLSVLAPERAPRLLMSWKERAKSIMALGVKVTALDFDADLARHSPVRFLELIQGLVALQGRAADTPLNIRCGSNWRFGKDGCGNADWLRDHGVSVTVVPAVEYGGETISSTRIRTALESGKVLDANAMLGRAFVRTGYRFAGKGIGASLGFPTLNVRLDDSPAEPRVRLPHGVYAVTVVGEQAIANYGCAPTFGTDAWTEPVVEVHFLKTIPDLASDGPIDVVFHDFIRPERKFTSVDALRAQIALDCDRIRA